MNKLTIIIPCYNESESLPHLFDQIKIFNKSINFIIIDNGSIDNTKQILKSTKITKNINIETKNKNTGYGAGIKYGLKYAKSKYVGWMHGDLQQNINVLKNIEKLLTNLDSDDLIALKGIRTKRSFIDNLFTISLSCITSILFFKKCWDIAGQPNIFNYNHINFVKNAPNDHTFEFYVYLKFTLAGGNFLRFNAPFLRRRFGASSWDMGLGSKISHSWKIFKYIFTLRIFNNSGV